VNHDTTFSGSVQISSSGASAAFTGALHGDVLYGKVTWRQTAGRSPPTHWGYFIAQRRH
jgi:hypothetical protein